MRRSLAWSGIILAGFGLQAQSQGPREIGTGGRSPSEMIEGLCRGECFEQEGHTEHQGCMQACIARKNAKTSRNELLQNIIEKLQARDAQVLQFKPYWGQPDLYIVSKEWTGCLYVKGPEEALSDRESLRMEDLQRNGARVSVARRAADGQTTCTDVKLAALLQ